MTSISGSAEQGEAGYGKRILLMAVMDDSQQPANSTGSSLRRIWRLALPAGLIVLLFVAWEVAPAWLNLLWSEFGRSTQRQIVSVVLHAMLAAYGLTLVSVVVGLPALGVFMVRSRKRQPRAKWPARLLLLGLSTLICLVGLEAGAALRLRWLHRSPEPPAMQPETVKAPLRLPTGFQAQGSGSGPGSKALRILVIGESSARGDPYHPWMSVGQIVGWQLERIFPGRPVQIEMWAAGGASLESMHQRMAELTYRPDMLLLFAGHNEFQARYQWARYPLYYHDVHPPRPETSLVDLVLRSSPYCRLILETLDRQLIDARPVQVAAPQVVDVPVCTEEEKAAIVSDFHKRVEAIATYCEVIGSLPLFIIPASNDGDYDPNRSILPAATPRAEREAFAHEFERAQSDGADRAAPRPSQPTARWSIGILGSPRPTFAWPGCWSSRKRGTRRASTMSLLVS